MILLLLWIINAFTLMVVAWLLPGFHIATFYSALIAALILGLLNILVRPLLLLLTLPVTILTLGLFTFVINALMLWISSSIVKGFTIDTFGTAIVAAILMWLISFATNWIAERVGSR